MSISDAKAVFGLTAIGTGDRPWINQSAQIGQQQTSMVIAGADIAFSAKLDLPMSGDSATLDLSDFAVTDDTTAVPTSVTITGTLTSDGATPVTFPALALFGEYDGRPDYRSEAIAQPEYRCYWETNKWYLIKFSGATPLATWQSSNDVPTPDLATFAPTGTATGVPTVTPSAELLASGWTGEAYDFEGAAMVPPSTIGGLLFFVSSGSISITQGTALVIPLSIGSKAQFASPDGDYPVAGVLTIASTVGPSSMYIAIIATS